MTSNQNTYYKIGLLFLILNLFGHGLLWSQTDINEKTNDTLELLFKQRVYDSVIFHLTKKQSKEKLSFRDYYLLSKSYGRTKQFGNGYVLTSEMIRKASEKKDTINLLNAFNLKAEHITDLHKTKEGSQFCDSIAPFFRKKDSIIFMKLCFKCGVLYNYNHEYEKAYKTYKKITKKEYKKLSLYTNNFALILERLKRYDEALIYLKQSLKNKPRDNPDLNVGYGNIGSIYIKRRKWKLAEIYLDSAYNAINTNSRLTSKKGIFENFYNLYNQQGNTPLAIDYLDSIYKVNEKILESRVKEKILSIEAANQNETLLVKRVKYIDNQLVESKNQVLKGTLILLSLIFILIISLFFFNYYHVQSSYKNILMNQRLSWTKFNPEYLSNSLIFLQKMIQDKNSKSISYLSKFSKLLRLILESSRKSLILLTEEIDTIRYYLELKKLEAKNHFSFDIYIEQNIEEQDIYIPPILIQPFIEQAVNNCNIQDSKKIKISFTYNNARLACTITYDTIQSKDQFHIQEETLDVIKNTKKMLRIFSKKLKTPSDLIIENINTDYIDETKITLILPHKNEEL